MSNIIPFDGGTLPAYLKNKNAAAINADLIAHAASGGFPSISIKGKVFAIVRDGERKILPNPKDPDSPATSIDVVMIKVNKGTSKVFYAKGYTEGEDAKPDCFSSEGVVPDPSSVNVQAKACATCKNNQWGSRISEQGKKGKACADSIRMAVAAPDALNDPMLLRVPAASIRAIGEYGAMLAKRGVAYNAVVTKISFDQDVATPKLLLKAVGFITEAAVDESIEMASSDVVQNILGAGGFTASESAVDAPDVAETVVAAAKASSKEAVAKSKTVTADEVDAAVEAAEAEVATPVAKAKPAAKAKPTPVEVDIDLDDLGDLNFDD
jgi:hypothetical protein